MIQTVVFDIGNIILYFDHEKMVRQLAATLQDPYSQTKKLLFDEDLLINFESGNCTTEDVIREL